MRSIKIITSNAERCRKYREKNKLEKQAQKDKIEKQIDNASKKTH